MMQPSLSIIPLFTFPPSCLISLSLTNFAYSSSSQTEIWRLRSVKLFSESKSNSANFVIRYIPPIFGWILILVKCFCIILFGCLLWRAAENFEAAVDQFASHWVVAPVQSQQSALVTLQRLKQHQFAAIGWKNPFKKKSKHCFDIRNNKRWENLNLYFAAGVLNLLFMTSPIKVCWINQRFRRKISPWIEKRIF